MDLLIYNDLYNKNNSLIKIWIFLIGIISCFLIIFYNIDYENYYSNSGIVIDNNILKIYISQNDLDKISNNNKLKIKDKTFAYKINSISDILFDSVYYREVIMCVDLENKLNIKNNIVDFKILIGKKTVLEYIVDKIGG